MKMPDDRLWVLGRHGWRVLSLLVLCSLPLPVVAEEREGTGELRAESQSPSKAPEDDGNERVPVILVGESTDPEFSLAGALAALGVSDFREPELLVRRPAQPGAALPIEGKVTECRALKLSRDELIETTVGPVLSRDDSGRAGYRLIRDELAGPALDQSRGRVGTEPVWNQGYTGEGQTVAILDSGIQYEHPFFSGNGKLGAGACFSWTEPAVGATTLCPEHSELPDPGHSHWACERVAATCWHGTHAASIVGGVDGANGLTGIAPGAKLVSIQVYSKVENIGYCGDSKPCLLSFKSDRLKALKHVYDNHGDIDIVYMGQSHGNYADEGACRDENPCLEAAILNLRDKGIPVIVPAGNGSQPDALGAPACIPAAVGVGATTEDDYVAGFSNVAPFLDLMAPGVAIDAADPREPNSARQGTSAAAAHVAGAWAVLKEAKSDASLDSILRALKATGDKVNGAPEGLRRIDLCRAYEALTDKNLGCS